MVSAQESFELGIDPMRRVEGDLRCLAGPFRPIDTLGATVDGIWSPLDVSQCLQLDRRARRRPAGHSGTPGEIGEAQATMATRTATDEHKRAILESLFEGGMFKSPDEEYAYRATDFSAEVPQTGERWDSRDALREMQRSFGPPPAVRLERVRGEGDLWVVEAVQTYERDGQLHTCLIVEFEGDKIAHETRYYVPHAAPPERG